MTTLLIRSNSALNSCPRCDISGAVAILAVACTGLLSGCGGDAPSGDTKMPHTGSANADAVSPAGTLRTLAATAKDPGVPTVGITNAQLFQWAQRQYPLIFGTGLPLLTSNYRHENRSFDLRSFKDGAYLGISEGRVYGLGPYTNGKLEDFGPLQQYADAVCASGPCGDINALNGCTLSADQLLRAGHQQVSVYAVSNPSLSDQVGEATRTVSVMGPADFAGRSSIQTSVKYSLVLAGQRIDTITWHYDQVAAGGMMLSLGSETPINGDVPVGARLRTVFDPPLLNEEHSLQSGQSLIQHYATQSIRIGTGKTDPSTSTTKLNYWTYQGRESIVVQGRRYEACRYRQVDRLPFSAYSLKWMLVDKGLLVRQEARSGNGQLTSLLELKSATLDGEPI